MRIVKPSARKVQCTNQCTLGFFSPLGVVLTESPLSYVHDPSRRSFFVSVRRWMIYLDTWHEGAELLMDAPPITAHVCAQLVQNTSSLCVCVCLLLDISAKLRALMDPRDLRGIF